MSMDGKEKRMSAEQGRLRKIFKDIPQDKMAVVDGLICQAARLRILLDDMWQDIKDKGDVEEFTQSPNTPPYERLRPVANLYNTRDKNYQTIIKQLVDLLPDDSKADPAEDLKAFLAAGKK